MFTKDILRPEPRIAAGSKYVVESPEKTYSKRELYLDSNVTL